MGEAVRIDRVVNLVTFEAEAKACTRCHELELLHVDETRGVARPMLQQRPTGALGILIVGEAPNWDDTYHPDKGHITYDAETDPTGRFMHSLLIDDVGLRADEIADVLSRTQHSACRQSAPGSILLARIRWTCVGPGSSASSRTRM